jgi:hypothetical protein
MNNQKDNERTNLNLYGQYKDIALNSLVNNDANSFINKKTEKLVTALYMVTDCMDLEDAVKVKLRFLGVNLLSDTFQLNIIRDLARRELINQLLSNIAQIVSLIEIAHTIGFISEMNAGILKREFNLLSEELKNQLEKDKNFSFSLNAEMFAVDKAPENIIENKRSILKDISYNGQNKRTDNIMSFTNIDRRMSVTKNEIDRKPIVHDKENKAERYEKIISLINTKKDSVLFSAEGISIKDIASEFNEYSEKTIQRDLNDLIAKGRIEKTGRKRWSRYKLATSN